MANEDTLNGIATLPLSHYTTFKSTATVMKDISGSVKTIKVWDFLTNPFKVHNYKINR